MNLKRENRVKRFLNKKAIIAALAVLLVVVLAHCDYHKSPIDDKGKALVQTYCSSCHLPVFPDVLDSITWIDKVLPAMAPKLGIKVWGKNNYQFPLKNKSKSEITYTEWMDLVSYYKREAPKKLSLATPPVPLKEGWANFQPHFPKDVDTSRIAATTLVKIDMTNGIVYSGEAFSNQLLRWDQSLESTPIRTLPSAPVDLSFEGDGKGVITCIGTLISRNLNQKNGEVLSFNLERKNDPVQVIADHLPRPVQALSGDFNKDGLLDWVVCGFGHDQGGLYLYQQTPEHLFEQVVISEMPGAEKMLVKDFNGDGWPDVMALFAQGREGIWLFLNDKEGGFSSRKLLEFPPVYGSTHFQLADFNGDGLLDILYTCGDNADYSPILKPFHGVYIFLNQGNFEFKQAYFYPMNGCTKAIAADFDGDGDLDIAAIAFFADFEKKPSESFIYFEQDSLLRFIPHSLPIGQYGRWISMDVGDYNHDGKPEIVLGNFSKGFSGWDSTIVGQDKHIPIVVLSRSDSLVSPSLY